jgi:hypothetical protein
MRDKDRLSEVEAHFFTFFNEKSFLLLARIEIITNFVHPIWERV